MSLQDQGSKSLPTFVDAAASPSAKAVRRPNQPTKGRDPRVRARNC